LFLSAISGSILQSLMPRSRWSFAIVLLACLVMSLVSVVYPVYVIRPFRAQGARELAAALTVAGFRPGVTVISAIAALAALAGYWRVQPRTWKRILSAVATGVVCVLAVLARVNVYELMFHPIDQASFALAAKSKLDGDEKVIAILVNGHARAYPIRGMSYHHIINDEVGRTAIVATY
jgi:hypothetical protein